MWRVNGTPPPISKATIQTPKQREVELAMNFNRGPQGVDTFRIHVHQEVIPDGHSSRGHDFD